MIDQLSFCTPYLGSNTGSTIPFIVDTQESCMSVGAGMFKDSSLMRTFPLPPPPPIVNISLVHMISSFTSGSIRYFDPCVVLHPDDFESCGAYFLLNLVEISSPAISSTSTNIGKHIHSHRECDHSTPPTRVVTSLS
jgi:hypothetical protein